MKTISILYEAGHAYQEDWEVDCFFCPVCGKKSLCVEQGFGDYYEGNEHFCRSCGCHFNTKGFDTNIDIYTNQRLKKLNP